MKIECEVDLKKFPYVCPFAMVLKVKAGDIYIPRGLLSDGASGVPDRCREGYFAHDKLYLCPEVEVKERVVRISKYKCDSSYRQIQRQNNQYGWAALYWVGLTMFPPSYFVWRYYRKREKKNSAWWVTERMVPHAACWKFPSFYAKDAVWIGPQV